MGPGFLCFALLGEKSYTSCHFRRQFAGITFFHPRLSAAFAEGRAAFPAPGKDNILHYFADEF